MKTRFPRLPASVWLAATLSVPAFSAGAQDTAPASAAKEEAPAKEAAEATIFSGTVSAWEDNVLVVDPGRGLKSVRYGWSKSTRYTDEGGKAVTRESIRPGTPVTVHYSKAGDRVVAERVVVRRVAAAPSTTRVTEEESISVTPAEAPPLTKNTGEVYRIEDDTLLIRTKNAEEPIKFLRSVATRHVDETDTPVKAEQLKQGMPVTIFYTEDKVDGTSVLRADKIMINRVLPAQPSNKADSPPSSASKAEDTLSGSVSTITPDSLSIRPQPGALPVKYTWKNEPVCVDEEGKPVDLTLVATGTPVTVQFSGTGENLTAERITVKRADLAPPGTTIEKRTERREEKPAPAR